MGCGHSRVAPPHKEQIVDAIDHLNVEATPAAASVLRDQRPEAVSTEPSESATWATRRPPLTTSKSPTFFVDRVTTQHASPMTARAAAEACRTAALRKRLTTLGASASLELSPAQVCGPARKGDVALGAVLDEWLCAQETDTDAPPPLPEGTRCFVNMVKTDNAHFSDVQKACSVLHQRGLCPIPHVPTCRFSTAAEANQVLDALIDAGSASVFLPGGNDQHEAGLAGAFASVGAALDAGVLVDQTAQTDMRRVVLAGHPEGHPGLGRSPEATRTLLLSKAERLMAAGRSVGVASQLCFDAEQVIAWVERTRHDLAQLHRRYPDVPPPTVHVGVHGPTKASRLGRIASICEVSSLFLDGAFDHIDTDHDGLVSEAELTQCFPHSPLPLCTLLLRCAMCHCTVRASLRVVQVSEAELLAAAEELHADADALHGLFELHAGSDGKSLQRYEFAEILADLGDAKAHLETSPCEPPVALGTAHSVSGPSTHVQQGATAAGGGAVPTLADEPLVRPEELVLALAAYAERESLAAGELVLHFYPFGGVSPGLQLMHELASGEWPRVQYH